MKFSSKVIFSSLFFFFAIFIFLTLIISNLNQTFSQLFLVFSYPQRAYDFISNFLLVCWVCMCIGFIVKSLRYKQYNILSLCIACVVAVLVFCVLLLRIMYNQDVNDVESMNYTFNGKIFEIFTGQYLEMVVYFAFYIFFVFAPLLLLSLRFSPNVFNEVGKRLEFYKPSLNISLFMLFAFAIQPYYAKNSPFLYVDLMLFYLGFVLVIVVLYRNKELFRFYEYANLLWLVTGMFIFIFCSKIINQADYNNARLIFIIIALMAWCWDWMSASLDDIASKNNKPLKMTKFFLNRKKVER